MDTADPRNLAAAVAARRKALGLNQSELSRVAGISQSTISLIENTGRVSKAPVLLALARAFGCTVDDLFRSPRQSRRRRVA